MEHSSWMERNRMATALNLTNADQSGDKFEMRVAVDNDSPLRKYFETYKTMKERERKLKLDTAGDEQQEEVSNQKNF